MVLLISVGIFVSVACFLFSLQVGGHERAALADARLKRATGQGAPLPRTAGGGAGTNLGLRTSRISRSQALTSLLGGLRIAASLEDNLSRSDWRMLTVSDFLLISAAAGLVPFVLINTLTGAFLVALAAGLLAMFTPRLLLARNIKRRRNTFNQQLVEVLSQLANSLKAGFGLLQAIGQAAEESKPPIATELLETLRDIRLGASIEDAFRRLNERVGSEDLNIVITAILVQRGAGGSLAEIMEGVGHTMRERVRIRGEINTLTTQGKYTGYLIGALPILLAGGFLLINRRYESLLFTTDLGHVMLAGWATMQVIGLLVIRKILNIEI